MSRAGTKRRSTRQAANSKRSVYAEPDTDDDFEARSEEDSPKQSSQRQRPPSARPNSMRKKQKIAVRSKPRTRSTREIKSQPRPKQLYGVGRVRKQNSPIEPAKKEFSGPSDGKIPSWTRLPIVILRDIFLYAAQPMHESSPAASLHATWLLQMAYKLKCRTLAVAALEAYYQSPLISACIHPHHLLELLETPKERQYINYNVKVKSLHIDVRWLAYTASGKPLFDLSTLVLQLPQLQRLEIHHPVHLPPFRKIDIQGWTYPRSLFSAFESRGHRLKSWRWSRDMIAERDAALMYNHMLQVHSSKTFEYLQRLVVCGFGANNSAEPQAPEREDAVVPPGLATSIAVLPGLKDLAFISCDVIMEGFMQRLPRGLERLELTNCLEITSDMLHTFFATSGSELRELVLNHNPALNLAFLPSLKASCPKLELLKINLCYYSERFNSNDAEPLYDELLAQDQIPTWPVTLRHLELVQLQRWSHEAASNLFLSVIESAESLPDLRCLILQAHINIPWRDRAGFRDHWIERLERVYARNVEDPCPYYGSLRQFRLWKEAQAAGRQMPPRCHVTLAEAPDNELILRRPLLEVQISPHKPTGEVDVYSDSALEKRENAPRRSRRVADHQMQACQASASATPTAESESEDGEVGADWRKQPEKFIQGLCTVVDIRIDNQRPRENQFTERDFLDREASGDEDWREDGSDDEEDRYAW